MNISMEDFLIKNKNGNLNVIDIRDKYKYDMSHIDGAINIPYNYLIASPNRYLNKNNTYYIYCYNGHTSRKIGNELTNLGYNIISINGGYNYYLLIK